MNLSTLLNDYEKSLLEKLVNQMINFPIVIKIISDTKLDKKSIAAIPGRLLVHTSKDEIKAGLFWSQMTPCKIPWLTDLFEINIDCSLDSEFSSDINTSLYRRQFYYDTRELNVDAHKNEFYIRYSFRLLPSLDQNISIQEHVDSYFESINLNEVYQNIFNKKISQVSPYINYNMRKEPNIAKRFNHERFTMINITNTELGAVKFCDFGCKSVEKFHLMMRLFFNNFSDAKLMELINNYDPAESYPYLIKKDIYTLSYSQDNVHDNFEEK